MYILELMTTRRAADTFQGVAVNFLQRPGPTGVFLNIGVPTGGSRVSRGVWGLRRKAEFSLKDSSHVLERLRLCRENAPTSESLSARV